MDKTPAYGTRYLLRTSRYGYTIEVLRHWVSHRTTVLIDTYEVRVVDPYNKVTVTPYAQQQQAIIAWRKARKELLTPFVKARKFSSDPTGVPANEDAEVLARLKKAQEELDAS